MDDDELSDAELVEGLRLGDERVFAHLYGRHTPSMIRVASSVVKGRATAEDVVQDTWMAVLKGISSFELRSTLAAWIFSILLNKARTRARRDGRVVSFDDDFGDDLSDAFDGRGRWKDMAELREDITPERIASGRSSAALVNAAIDALPPPQRAVIILRVQQELEASEVCALLGISEGNMRVLLHRARLALRARMLDLGE
ncbi:RNA polymerase sigma factor [Anianabacter salinae]|uniref:RNA polymerase sigma factor n=1 Tax=Anianabacter salinae TaxID=2851023 RepID=UPI00225E43D2|nr:RNA polymerase sigma factor [Anianabacter salinae]